MITPKELRAKTEKAFFKVVSSRLKGEDIFPWTIPSNKQIAGTNYNEWKADLLPLHQQSKKSKGKGYTVEWKPKTINGTKQSVPSKIYYDTFDDFLFFIGRTADFQTIDIAFDLIIKNFPVLKEWAACNPAILLENKGQWNDLLKVCDYFTKHQPPHPFFMRDLPITVHTKFVEDNSGLLKKLLDLVLPAAWVKDEEKDFALRYSLKKVSVYTQLRILDDALKPYLAYDDCSLTLDDARWLKWSPQKVFIIENEICYHTFPKVENAVSIFGEGFKSRISRHLPWLEKTELYCWFDLDAAGFEMLNMIREYYPNAKAFLMDEKTYNTFSTYAVANNYRRKQLDYLTGQERSMYQFLVDNQRRLEQERITHEYIKEHLP